MEKGSSNYPPCSQPACEVCGCALGYLDSLQNKDLDYSVCKSFTCQKVMINKISTSPLLFKFHLSFQKKIIHDQWKREAAKKKRIDEIKTRESQENQKIIQSILLDNAELSTKNTQAVVIPTGLSNTIPPAQERVDKYIEHLNNIISEAASYKNVTEVIYGQHQDAHEKLLKVEQRFSQNPTLEQLSNQLCGLCKGGCCVAGEEHAYLSVFTIRSMMDNNQDISETDILNQYLSRISPKTVENSCINQTPSGCALPRELRSDICNAFYCDTLKSCQSKMENKHKLGTVIAIQRANTYSSNIDTDANNEIVNVMLLDDEQCQLLNINARD